MAMPRMQAIITISRHSGRAKKQPQRNSSLMSPPPMVSFFRILSMIRLSTSTLPPMIRPGIRAVRPLKPSVTNIYSISENYLWRSVFAGVNLKYDFDILNWLSISPAFMFDYNYTYFNAKNGYGWYATSNYTETGKNESWDSPYAKFFPKGKLYGITYNRMSLETWLGFSVTFLPIKQLQIELSSFINPIVYMESFDHHEKKGYYADIAYNYFESFKAKIHITGNITKSISVSLNSTLKYIPETLGEAYYSHDNSAYSYIPLTSTQSGSGEFIVDISISGSYKF